MESTSQRSLDLFLYLKERQREECIEEEGDSENSEEEEMEINFGENQMEQMGEDVRELVLIRENKFGSDVCRP